MLGWRSFIRDGKDIDADQRREVQQRTLSSEPSATLVISEHQ
jgi:hypothetical protein